MTKFLLAGFCVSLLGCAFEDESADLNVEVFELTGTSHWSTEGSSGEVHLIGSATNRACFLSGIGGAATTLAFPQGNSIASAGVRINASNQWEIYISQAVSNSRLRVTARCFTSTSLTDEVSWSQTQNKVELADYAPNRRCFLTSISTNRYGTSHGGFYVYADKVEITNDARSFYLGGSQSGGTYVKARCVTVNQQLSNTLFYSAFNGTVAEVPVNIPMAGSVCGLTSVFGRLTDGTDDFQGPRIEPSGDHYLMTAKDETGGRALCVN